MVSPAPAWAGSAATNGATSPAAPAAASTDTSAITGATHQPAGPTASGQSPAGESPALTSVRDQTLRPNNSQTVFPVEANAPVTAQPVRLHASASTGASATNAPRIAAGGIETGYVSGTVVDAAPPYDPVSGALVTVTPLSGFCPSSGCNPVTTSPTGQFTSLAATGENLVLVQDGFYITNRTWAYVSDGGDVSVGTIRLIEDGFVSGTVLGDDPAHEPVSGIRVLGLTRDGSFESTPSGHTDATGHFSIAVPPVPSEIQFLPIAPDSVYESNFTFVNVSSGQSVDLGVIYLERTTLVAINLVDAVTGLPVIGNDGFQAVSEITSYQPPQATLQGGPEVVGPAPVGPDSVTIYATGYLTDTVQLGVVPQSTPSTAPVEMGTFALEPLGQVDVTVGIQGGLSLPGVEEWGIGEAIISACTLDAVDTVAVNPATGNFTVTDCTGGCDPFVGDAVEFAALPMRNFVTVVPDTSGICEFGIPTWPIPGDVPVFENYAWTNVTPDAAVDMGHLDLLPGTYVQGSVEPATITGWTVQACSTDEPALCGLGASDDDQYLDALGNFIPAGCVQPGDSGASTTFCVATPPGPVKFQVTIGNATNNLTWGENPPYTYNQMPLPLSSASALGVTTLNLTAGNVSGVVLQARSLTPVPGLPAVTVCSAGVESPAVPCGSGAVNASGDFAVYAPLGWDKVTISAPSYVANSTWVYVKAANSTGRILLTPDGYVTGRVVNSAGVGLSEAQVQLCLIATLPGCLPLGADGGTTSTDGTYFGPTPAGSLPLGAYQIVASAPGYETDWTWLNVTTPGENFTAPTIVLSSVPTGPQNSTSFGAWVAGRVIDAANGIGLPGAALAAQPVLGGPPDLIGAVRGTGGEFNDTVASGGYVLTVSLTGFYPTTLFFNVTGTSPLVSLGTIALTPYPHVTGRLVIEPWGPGEPGGLGPGGAQVSLCARLGSPCGPPTTVSSEGFFNTSGPAGLYDVLYATGQGGGTGSYNGGFDPNSTYINVTNSPIAPALTDVGLPIFGTILGSLAQNHSSDHAPVWFESIVADTTIPVDATYPETVNASGDYTIYFPPSIELDMTAGGLGAWVPQGHSYDGNTTVRLHVPGSNLVYVLVPGGVTNLDTLSKGPSFQLDHFGWVNARVVVAGTHAPLPFAEASVQSLLLLWGLPAELATLGEADGNGFLNITAPPSVLPELPDVLNVTAPDFGSNNSSAVIASSATTLVGGTNPRTLNGMTLEPWGWITGQAIDPANGHALVGATPVATDPAGDSSVSSTVTNGLGEFRIDAPPSSLDRLSIALSGYTGNVSFHAVGHGATVHAATANLVGDGIVEGIVLAYPSGVPVAGASVAVCPRVQPSCTDTVTTNASGLYVAAAPAGADVLTVSAAAYVTSLPDYVTVTTDTWAWVGRVVVDAYATVTGVALGLPEGVPLAGANASLCAQPGPGGVGAGPCFTTVGTGLDGSFKLQAPAGDYVLELNASGYNSTYLEVALTAGGTLPVGTVFLQQYGTATGSVAAEGTGATIPGARVQACEAWGGGICLPSVAVDVAGNYVFTGPAGPYVVEAYGPGVQAGYERVVLASGATVRAPPFSLIGIGPGNRYVVSGVVDLADSGGAVAGAVVTASGGFSATTNASGGFSMVLPWGTYTLTARLAGYYASAASYVVNGPVAGIRFGLTLATWAVSGTVVDGLTGAAIAGVAFSSASGLSLGNVSGPTGTFVLQLPNGTTTVVVTPPSAASPYAGLSFAIAVSGAPLQHDLALYPAGPTVSGLVANSLTGQGVAGATVTFSGSTVDGAKWTTSTTTAPSGRFSIPAYPGQYMVTVTGAGYRSTEVPFAVAYATNETSVPLSLSLTPMSSASTGAGLSLGTLEWVGVAAVAIAAVGGGLAIALRRRSAPKGGS
jgi:hypothetical protein